MESEMTSSSFLSVMPRTPVEVRLWNSRTSVAWKRIALPWRVASSTSSSSVSSATPIRRSSLSRSEEHTSELQSLMRISYAVFCLKKKTTKTSHTHIQTNDIDQDI